ncbi:1,2-phenylacetyl-CoA epoxidase subunit PaaE [Corynebacterium nasicanis]|uniref:1,2-phenylacetyl-CoA epoxidase subunit PaaE n=1 Tax=Corynebacterium nasicanis TaxID=1448267 RepID=A0ABW1QF56_9CORY
MTAPTKKKAKFNPLEVSEVRRLTDNAVEVSFEVPEELRDDYDYVPGQYVALRADIDGQEVRRSYSICDIPRPGTIRVAIKRDLGGVFSTWANDELTPGTVIEVMNPQGAFTSRVHVTSLNDAQELLKNELADVDGAPHLVAIAAGSGITPIMSIAQALLSGSKAATFEIVYANKGGGDVMFAEEIGDLKDKYPTRFAVHHVLSREQRVNPLFSGRIDDEKLSLLLDKVVRTSDTDEWFLCGPFELVQLVRDELEGRGVNSEKVRFELFSTGKPQDGPGQGNTGRPVVADPHGRNITVSFTLDGLSGSIESPASANETILNAALRARPDVPFACAGGVCGTCRAKVVEGEFEMDENYALEADEVANGYVLTCQTRATGDSITVDYDA